MPHEVLIAIGPYEAGFKALSFAADLYKHVDDAHLHVIHIETSSTEDTADELLSEGERVIEEEGYTGDYTVEKIDEESVSGSHSQVGGILTSYIDEQEPDHILMGQPDRSLLNHLLKGSATDKVLENTDNPVTLVGTEHEEPRRHLETKGD